MSKYLLAALLLTVAGVLYGAGEPNAQIDLCDCTKEEVPPDCCVYGTTITDLIDRTPDIDSACTTKDCCLAYATIRCRHAAECRWPTGADRCLDPNMPIMFSGCLEVHFDACVKGEHK